MRTRLALIVVLCLGLVACGGGEEEGTGLSSGPTTGDGSSDDDATDQGGTDDADTTGTDDADTSGSDDTGPDTKGSCVLAEDCVLGFGQDDPCAPHACEDGWCVQTSLEEAADCDDGDACTENTTCQAGQCAGDSLKCDDDDDCTADTCDFKEGCQNTTYKDGTSCEDGSECTKNDKCNNGQCKGGKNTCVEDCGNEKDDNENELIDCADPQCMGSLECPTECEAIAPITCGETVTVEIGGEDSTTNVGMWACSFQAWNGPESAWKFSWANPADVTITAKGSPDGIQLMRADDPAGIGCLPAFCTEAHASELSFSSDPSSSYWIIVESDGQITGSFQLEVACQECVPDCTGKTCGGDGCNGSCGSCSGGKVCASGACVLKPDNESCEQPAVLDPAVGFPIIVSGTTAGASAGYDLAPTSGCDGSANDGFGLGAADVVYSFTPTVTQEYLIAVNADFDTAFGIFLDCSDLQKTCVAAGNTPGYGVEKVTKQLNKGYTYFIIVDGYTAGKSGSFNLTITTWPCSPDCSG
ncbi:MAG TPA: hypothetical protein EYN66_18290, partial [Myxococcales bacterium]|nr:hypothetical protein [Myxococcales bacterium]